MANQKGYPPLMWIRAKTTPKLAQRGAASLVSRDFQRQIPYSVTLSNFPQPLFLVASAEALPSVPKDTMIWQLLKALRSIEPLANVWSVY